MGAAREDRRPPRNHDAINPSVAETLNGNLKIHALRSRAAPRIDSAFSANTCIRRARAAELSLICFDEQRDIHAETLRRFHFPPAHRIL